MSKVASIVRKRVWVLLNPQEKYVVGVLQSPGEVRDFTDIFVKSTLEAGPQAVLIECRDVIDKQLNVLLASCKVPGVLVSEVKAELASQANNLVKRTADLHGYPCPKCKQLFDVNPEDPPPPHTKPDSDELCVFVGEWREEIENCP